MLLSVNIMETPLDCKKSTVLINFHLKRSIKKAVSTVRLLQYPLLQCTKQHMPFSSASSTILFIFFSRFNYPSKIFWLPPWCILNLRYLMPCASKRLGASDAQFITYANLLIRRNSRSWMGWWVPLLLFCCRCRDRLLSLCIRSPFPL